MTYQLDILTELGGRDITVLNQYLDDELNSKILYALLYGVYSGIFAITLWNIFIHNFRPIGRVTTVAVVLLFIFTTIDFGLSWFLTSSAFIANGQSFQSKFLTILFRQNGIFLGTAIMSILNTIVADSTMMWRCWIVSGQRWPAILPPILMLISGTVFRIKDLYQGYTTGTQYVLGLVLDLSFILATTIWCTTLIIYFILAAVRSSALYSVFLILFVLFEQGLRGYAYISFILFLSNNECSSSQGIAPTLLIGRVAAGHARSENLWQGSTMSSLHFGTSRSQNSEELSLEDEASQSSVPDQDLEAHWEEMYGHEYTGNGDQECIGLSSDDMLRDDPVETQPEGLGDQHGRAVGRLD
ncbi:hypothetical protein IW261DRAFT_1624528 [Armillaria novae-zelandiae]|uniref:Uncharacterized protein n=1 Tax=Armillaria novae-zelandiae TaxID=153914 RepID=A0AA39ND47_9AGAR|nr:hypothetical protein IW261DRAFT_1624528 [Armillaria novae-zelandiae]